MLASEMTKSELLEEVATLGQRVAELEATRHAEGLERERERRFAAALDSSRSG